MNIVPTNIPEALTEAEAFAIGDKIAHVEGCVRLAKGQLWNACEDGARVALCDRYEWKYPTMVQFGMYAEELASITAIAVTSEAQPQALTYTHWNATREEGASKDQRQTVLTQAINDNLTPNEVRQLVRKLKAPKPIEEENKPQEATEPSTTRQEPFRTTPEEDARYKQQYLRELEEPSMTAAEALSIMGIMVPDVYKISSKALSALYREASKQAHPDVSGSDEDMKRLNAANELLTKLTTL